MNGSEVTALLRRVPLRVSTEAQLHESISGVLADAGISFARESRLSPGDRIDFLCEGGIGIEVKARCDRRSIFRQLTRYAASDKIEALILVTGTAIGLPAFINDTPVFLVSTGRAAL